MKLCAACGHAAKDTYAVDPATGRPAAELRWCAPCYERENARYARERHLEQKRDGLYAK